MKKSITQNATYMTLASVFQKVIAFVYFTIIANSIGAEGTGKYFFALSFTTIFVVFIDLGFTNVFIREAARAKQQIQVYLSTLLAFKLGMSVLVYLVAIVLINLLGYPAETRHLVYISGITMLFDTFHLTMYGALRAIGDLRYESMSIVGSQLLTLLLGSIFLAFKLPLVFLMLAFTIPSAFNVLFVGVILAKKYQIYPKTQFDTSTFQLLLKIAIPFALAAIFARLYSYMDTMILSKIAGDLAVGYYSVPYKITFAFQFIPLALVAALYPRFSEYFIHNKQKLAYIFERSMKYLLMIAVPIAVGIAVLSKDIILFIYTDEYSASILPLQILIASLIFSYVSFPIGAFLNACNKQVVQTMIVGIVLCINIGLNVSLIPVYGATGAAIAACAGNFFLALLGYLVVPKVTSISHTYIGGTFVLVLLSAGVMGGLVWYTNIYTHFVVAILAGVLSYCSMLVITRLFTRHQLRELRVLFHNK